MASTWPELHAGTTFGHVWDVAGLEWVKETQPGASSITASAGTEYTEDAASVANPVGGMLMARRRDTLATETSADGDVTAVNVTAKGELYVKHEDAMNIRPLNALFDFVSASITDSVGALITQQTQSPVPGDAGLIVRNIPQGAVVSTSNSSTATLTSGSTFTGAWEDVSPYSSIVVSFVSDVQSDATSGFKLQWSTNGVNLSLTSDPLSPNDTNGAVVAPVLAKYFRVVYVNSGTNQASFKLQTLLSPASALSNVAWSLGSSGLVNLADKNVPLVASFGLMHNANNGKEYPIRSSDDGKNLRVQLHYGDDAIPTSSADHSLLVGGSDGATLMALRMKGASIVPLATDPALVVTMSPNSGSATEPTLADVRTALQASLVEEGQASTSFDVAVAGRDLGGTNQYNPIPFRTIDPGGTDRAVVTRNIPSGTQAVSLATLPTITTDVQSADDDSGYADGDLAKKLSQTPDGRLRVSIAAKVSDARESYQDNQVRSLSLTSDGRLRVSTSPADIDLEFFREEDDLFFGVPVMARGGRYADVQNNPWGF